ncbi:MAG: hypothetical protein ACOC90_00065 [Bacteroidota bacterium]
MFVKIRFTVLIIVLVSGLLVCPPSLSFAKAQGTVKGVGFASMKNFSFESELWTHHFSKLAKESYWFKYSSFRQIVEKLQMKNMHPFGLELPPQGEKIMPANEESVREFFMRWDTEGDEFLRNLGLANNAALIVFDYVGKMDVKRYIRGETDHFLITIMVYYLDSNAIGMNHVKINKEHFNERHVDFPEIKSEIQSKILEALEDAVINTRGLITENFGVGSSREEAESTEDARTSTGNGKDGEQGSREGSDKESDLIEESYLSDQEKSDFWE